MTLATLLVVVPVAVPLLAAGLALLLGPWPTAQRVLGTTVPTAVVVDAALLLHRADAQGPVVAQAGGYPVPLGITLVADRFSALVLIVSSIVLLLVVEQEEVVQRLVARGAEQGRSDDTEETIRRRLEVYAEQTAPLIDVYEQRGLVRRVDGMASIDEVTASLLDVLGAPASR